MYVIKCFVLLLYFLFKHYRENSHANQSVELIRKSILTEDGNPARYRLQTTTDNPNQSESYRKITFGERDTDKPHKIILMVGETGTGKTTLINAMINYICGVKREDKVWFEITDDQSDRSSAHSQTSIITVYGVYIQETSVDLTIIDTPGYGDTRGAERSKEITETLLRLCTTDNKLHQIDAVCFVIMAQQNQLSDRQQYIFDAVQSLFGKDIAENIVLLLTNSNGSSPKTVLKAVRETEVKCAVDEKNQPIYFLFDNCQGEKFDEENQTFQDQSWDLSYRGMTELFKFLDMIQPKTLEENKSENKLGSGKELCNIDELKKKNIKIKDGNPARYRLKTTTDNLDQSESYRIITFGKRDTDKAHKIILMVGETGSGKTTLINTMINYICGVQRKDKVWFEITDDQSNTTSVHSQTSIITVYGVYIQETSVDLTIIDTPGYGDTRGADRDKEIVVKFHNLTKSADGLDEISAVCLVCNSSYTRLSDEQRKIFDSVQSLFGKDIVDNIVLLFTHSTGFPPKNALTAVKEAKIKCAVDEKNQPIYFLFDNRQGETLDEEKQTIQDQSWDLSYRGMTEFFKFLDRIKPKTLEMTRDVLKKRQELEPNISDLQLHVQEMKEKQNKLKQTQNALEKHKQEVQENKNFEYEVEVPYKEKVDIDPAVAKKAKTCTVCEENCHYPGCGLICDYSGCSVMKNYHCTVCTNKCHTNKHTKEAKIYVTKIKTETRTKEDLKKKYEDKINYCVSVINKLKEELQELEKDKIKLVVEAYHCVESLKMITLNTESLFTVLHIDFLIEKLKEINEPEKAEALKNIK
ncbi:uncharacterized protein [Misgurnus anguillicaudatus]|uniref:uncharacterized protein n=1 Tax=Misgurnus anguillicaudatus TaxID=75329 RepID=UPI003CCF2315